jgi:diguanylate cyclase (GGDEF)-like protein
MFKNRIQSDKGMIENDVIERIAYITSELDQIIDITKKKEIVKDTVQLQIPLTMGSIFKYLVMRNITKGRMAFSTYLSGKEMGLSCGIKSKESLIKITKRIGLGQLKFHTLDEHKITIEIHDSLSSKGIKESGQHICFFEAGFLSGVVENILGRKVDFREVECRSQGEHKYCVFKMLQPGEEIKIEGVTIPLVNVEHYSSENVKMLTSLAAHSIAAIENTLIFETTKKQALVDHLTGVFNHRFFQQTIRTEMSRAHRFKAPLSLLMCDIDNFKMFNDKFSHMTGDEVLRKVAETLVSSVRSIDYVTRYGGDEFAIILPQTNLKGAKIVAKKIIGQVKEIGSLVKKYNNKLGITVGAAAFDPKARIDPAQLIDKADKALLKAKTSKSSLGF